MEYFSSGLSAMVVYCINVASRRRPRVICSDSSLYVVSSVHGSGSVLVQFTNTVTLCCVQIVLALRYLHKDRGIIHRDLTPNNVMIDENDKVTVSEYYSVNKTKSLYQTRPNFLHQSTTALKRDSLKPQQSDKRCTVSQSTGLRSRLIETRNSQFTHFQLNQKHMLMFQFLPATTLCSQKVTPKFKLL